MGVFPAYSKCLVQMVLASLILTEPRVGVGRGGAEQSVEPLPRLIHTPETSEVRQNTVNTSGVLEGSPALWSQGCDFLAA